jgi:hypothetical protein
MAQVLATDQGWIIRIPDDMAPIMGVVRGSVGVLHPTAGGLNVEILPPLEQEMRASVLQGCEELREAFEELKRLGD